MKYKQKPENRPVNEIKELITCLPAYLSLKAKVKAKPNIVNHIKCRDSYSDVFVSFNLKVTTPTDF